MNIITYNVNGIRSAASKGLLEWVKDAAPDVLCVQETKAQQDQMPALIFQEMGYHCYNFSAQKKGYSGVAIFTKQEPDKVVVGMNMPSYDNEGRFLRADFGPLSVVSVYHPSGSSGDERQAFKMQWLEDFLQYITALKQERPYLILCGDYNICHKPIDIHNPAGHVNTSGFLPEERQWMDRFIDSGFIDTFRTLHPDEVTYSWWSYRFQSREKNAGWRIDYFLISERLRDKLQTASIHTEIFGSDHCPVEITLSI